VLDDGYECRLTLLTSYTYYSTTIIIIYNLSSHQTMSAEFTTDSGPITLQEGTYSWAELQDAGLAKSIVTEVCLQPYVAIEIFRGSAVILQLENSQADPLLHKFCCRVHRDTRICIRCLPRHNLWDYIIVGLGAAGAILARKLSDDYQTKVLVIEAGVDHEDDPVISDPNWQAHIPDLLYNPLYALDYAVPSSNPANPFGAKTYSEGTGYGGSSAHCFRLAVRGTPPIYDYWEQASGNPAWSYANLLPGMKAIEHYYPNAESTANPQQRGFTGPISVTQRGPLPPTAELDALIAAFNAPYSDDYNDLTKGVIVTSTNQEFATPDPNGHNSYAAYELVRTGEIVDADGNGLDGRLLKVVANAKVLHFDSENGHATSVQYVVTTKDIARVRRAYLAESGTLILAAGSVNTPRILLSSGVGPATELTKLGIPIRVDSPQVGKNFQTHYGSNAVITGNAGSTTVIFSDLGVGDSVRRLQISVVGIGNNLSLLVPGILQPKSGGSVVITDPNPLTQAKLTINTYTDGDETVPGSDLNLMVQFYRRVKAAADAAGETVLSPPAFAYASDASLAAFARMDANITIFSHGCRTARMSTDISTGVVDGELRVYGLDNVRVCDASIMPKITNGNTCFPVYYTAVTLLSFLGY
jgi:choline dehydrogenase